MLDEICGVIRNYFIRSYDDIHTGTFTISDGEIESLPFLLDGQYYRIVGSVLNDGVYKYGDTSVTLKDEMFCGAVWAMAVPQAVIDLDAEITQWIVDNAEVLKGPYQSESFGGYSYAKASKSSGGSGNGNGAYSWQDQFANQLGRWRRVSIL